MSINRGMDKEDVVHIYNGILAIKKEPIVPFAETWIDLETVIQSEVSQKEKNKYHIMLLICGIQKNGTDELICKAEIETQVQRTNLWTPRGAGWWNELGYWDLHIYTIMYKIDN